MPASRATTNQSGHADGRGRRFKLTTNADFVGQGTPGDGTPFGVATSEQIRNLFHSGVDYWQHRLHAHHAWAMKQVVQTLRLLEHRSSSQHALALTSGPYSAPRPAPAASASSPPRGDQAGSHTFPSQCGLRGEALSLHDRPVS